MHTLLLDIGLLALLVLIGCLITLVVLKAGERGPSWQEKRAAFEESLAAEWADTVELLRSRPNLAVIEVGHTYQRAKRGSKAIVRWADSGAEQDTWFWHATWPHGTVLVVSPSMGWGPHNHNPRVLYLEKERVIRRVDRRAPAAAAAVERRRREQRTGEAA